MLIIGEHLKNYLARNFLFSFMIFCQDLGQSPKPLEFFDLHMNEVMK